jgi:hypothetical protein
MNTESNNGLNTQFLIFIAILIVFNLFLFSMIEYFPFGSYTRSNKYGRLIPRDRDRDEIVDNNLTDEKDLKNDVNSVDAIQQINTDLDAGKYSERVYASSGYKWNGNINFPYGGFTYERSYPVYPAPNICNKDKPYWSTLEGKCIAIDNAHSQSPSPSELGQQNNIVNMIT